MSIKRMNAVWDQSRQRGTRLLLEIALADNASDNGLAWPGISTLAQRARIGERAVMTQMGHLEQSLEVLIYRQDGKHNHYIVMPGLTEDDLEDAIKQLALRVRSTPKVVRRELWARFVDVATPDRLITPDQTITPTPDQMITPTPDHMITRSIIRTIIRTISSNASDGQAVQPAQTDLGHSDDPDPLDDRPDPDPDPDLGDRPGPDPSDMGDSDTTSKPKRSEKRPPEDHAALDMVMRMGWVTSFGRAWQVVDYILGRSTRFGRGSTQYQLSDPALALTSPGSIRLFAKWYKQKNPTLSLPLDPLVIEDWLAKWHGERQSKQKRDTEHYVDLTQPTFEQVYYGGQPS